MRVLIADDHNLVRAGIRRLLESFRDIEVVAEARNGYEALDLVSLHRPDVALLDLSMPLHNGFVTTTEICRNYPDTRVVIISMHTDLAHVREALDRGAKGFLVKEAAPGELELALRAAANGETFLSPQVASRMVNSFFRREAGNDIDHLSPRQREILAWIGRGESTKEIAAALNVSVKTIETHRARMMETLGCRRASDLVRLAIHHVGGMDAPLG